MISGLVVPGASSEAGCGSGGRIAFFCGEGQRMMLWYPGMPVAEGWASGWDLRVASSPWED